MIFKSAKSGTNINIITMKAGAWYVAGFVVAFVYFYVYAVNYIRGVRSDDDVQLKTDLEHLPQFLEQFSSSREARNAEALWPLAMRSGSLKSNPNGKTFTKKKLRVRKRPIKVSRNLQDSNHKDGAIKIISFI